MKRGDKVWKYTGDYQLAGEVRSVFTTKAGKTRYVVEHDPGFLHIYSRTNLCPYAERHKYVQARTNDGVRKVSLKANLEPKAVRVTQSGLRQKNKTSSVSRRSRYTCRG